MILPECRWMWDGVEARRLDRRQSAQVAGRGVRLLGVLTCASPSELVRVMSTNPSYLQTAADAVVKNYRDWGLPLGRRFRALKLWFLIREQGVAGLQARLRRDLDNAQWLAAERAATPDWRVLAPVVLQTVCVRHEPAGVDGRRARSAHAGVVSIASTDPASAYLTPALLDGRWMVRVSIGALATERRHVGQRCGRTHAGRRCAQIVASVVS